MANILVNLDSVFILDVKAQSSLPSGIEIAQEGVPVSIEDVNSTDIGNNNNKTIINNNDLPKCFELKSFDKMLMAEWQLGKITDEQAMYLGKQIKDLMINEGCIN
jgi:hypothetical protein